VAVTDDSKLFHFKEPSTPDDPSAAVVSGLSRVITSIGVDAGDIASIAHGTTIGLNAIIQRSGADIALVISRGHRDVLELTRRLPKEFDLRQPRVQPLVPRNRIIEIDARLNARGEVVDDPDDAEIARVAREVQASGAGAVAVTVLHSYLDPIFEAGVGERLAAALPGIPVSTSSAIWPEIREYNRTSVVALNAYITPLIENYLDGLKRRLSALGVTAPLYITASNGGSLGLDSARERPIDTILSGPASGVTASLLLAKETGLENIISFDMGGTSSDIAVAVSGQAEFATRTEVGGLPLILPVIDVNAIGAGGGSIAWIDEQGALKVGPESAGAVPGPAAYGLGGDNPTITDAYVLTGIIDPARFLGGEKVLDVNAARDSMASIAGKLDHHGDDAAVRAAADILGLATVSMAAELQKVLARRGFEAGEFTLVPFGGAGPTHAALLAEDIGISSIAVPLSAGTYCALGAVGAPLRRDYLRGIGRPLDVGTSERANSYLRELINAGRSWATTQGDAVESVEIRCSLEMRYYGQAFELDVEVSESELPLSAKQIAEAFHAEHEKAFGHRDHAADLILIAAKVTAVGGVRPIALGSLPQAEPEPNAAPRVERDVFVGGTWLRARVLGADDLADSLNVRGPAVIDLNHTTILVPPAWTVTAAGGNSLRLLRS
jgi:N-methylhydantoinase A